MGCEDSQNKVQVFEECESLQQIRGCFGFWLWQRCLRIFKGFVTVHSPNPCRRNRAVKSQRHRAAKPRPNPIHGEIHGGWPQKGTKRRQKKPIYFALWAANMRENSP